MPVGRLRRLSNGIVQKHRPDGSIRVDKRRGFHALSPNSFNVTDGSVDSTDGISGTTLLAALGDELVQIGDSVPYVYAPSGPRFERFQRTVMTETARRRVVHAGTESISIPDAARVGNVHCYVWKAGGACYATFIDDATQTPIRTPFEVAGEGRVKIVSDGVRFWLFRDNDGTDVQVIAYGTDGVAQGLATVGPLWDTDGPWDVMAMPGTGNGAVFVERAASSTPYIRLNFLTWSAGIVNTGPVFNEDVPTSFGLGWMRNDFDDEHLYLATSTQFAFVPPVGPDLEVGVYAARLNLDGTLDELYVVKDDLTSQQAIQIGALSGHVESAAQDIWVSWTSFSIAAGANGRPMNNTVTTVRVPSGGAAGAPRVDRSVSLAGRVFRLGSRYLMPVYYASVSGEAAVTSEPVPVAQATYFLLDVETGDIVGRLEHGRAAFDWPFIEWDGTSFTFDFFWLPSPFEDATGNVRLPFGFAANVSTVQFFDGFPFNYAVPQVGLLDIRLGGSGVAIEYADELLLPGPMGITFTGDAFLSAGIELGAEAPLAESDDDADGAFEAGEQHRYVIVYSVLDSQGNRTRSVASVATGITTVLPGDNAILLTIPTLRMTMHETVLIEIYRDVWDATNNVAGTSFRKITVDEATPGDDRVPLYNDPTQDTVAFVDTVSNNACAIGEILYTENGTLDFFPCPTFSTGCVFGDRVFVGGYDDRIYYSFARVPGQALAFNQDVFFFTVPTSQRVTALVPMDNRLIIFCERSIWYVDGGAFLSPDGLSGSNPSPIELKFANGCTGRALAITAGILYASSAGGLWLLTRGLENEFVGKNVEDDTDGAEIIDIAVDKNQRIACFTETQAIVYDQVVGVWSPWPLTTPPVAGCAWRGAFVYADDEEEPRTMEQVADAFDDDGDPIVTRVDLQDVSLADINGFQVIWEASCLGEWIGAHMFHVELAYDRADAIDETFEELFDEDIDPYHFDWQPRTTECSAIRMSIWDSFPGDVPSGGFALESIGLYVGIERGAKYSERRIAPAT
jgi:hypothetical protein